MSLPGPAAVILARHGQAGYETPAWTDEGGSLTTLGRTQAAGLASGLQGRRVTHVYCSTMARAVQTAEIAAAILQVDVTTRLGLQEFAVGEFAGTNRDTDPFLPTFRTWLDGDLSARIAGAESVAEVVARGRTVLEALAERHPGETVLMVAHGGILTMLVRHLFTVEGSVTPRPFVNCGYAETQLGADGWRLTGWSAD